MAKCFLFLVVIFYSISSQAEFKEEAQKQAQSLKKVLLGKVKEKMAEGGPLKAVEFCHEEALGLTESAAKKGFLIGRTTDKTRNPKNKAKEWMKDFLKQAKDTTAEKPYEARVVKNDKNEDVFISPLYTAAACLQCHARPSGALKDKLTELYPNDQATGYRLGEFRGFVWVKEKRIYSER